MSARPWLVTPDEFADPDDLELGCAINGVQVQKSRTSHLIISVPQLIESLSSKDELADVHVEQPQIEEVIARFYDLHGASEA